jgi:hypothetical protein
MARRITVSVPDLLHEKMEEWRQSFNLSKLFQDAISEAIRRKEEFQKRIHRDYDLSETIARLRREKAEAEGSFYDSGIKAGLTWAKSVHYNDLRYAVDWDPKNDALKDKVLGAYFDQKLNQRHFIDPESSAINENGVFFLKGWHKGVVDFWDEIKNKL